MSFSKKITDLKREVLKESEPLFAHIEDVAEANTLKVLDAMRECRVSDAHFNTTTGYAYDDIGRGKLEELYAKIFGAERALVRTQFVSGTHALATVLFGILRPGDELVSLTGKPYDTMQTVIGYDNPSPGSLKEFGVLYNELPMVAGKVDMAHIKDVITDKTKMVEIQRSRGYSMRSPLSIEDIRAITAEVHRIKPDCICFVDNCYGEFVDYEEPTQAGADIMAGSLIKNPGGGIAPTGGYIVGRDDLVELASYRLTAPGMGDELGASLSNNRLLFQGLFLAPHVVSQAIKGAISRPACSPSSATRRCRCRRKCAATSSRPSSSAAPTSSSRSAAASRNTRRSTPSPRRSLGTCRVTPTRSSWQQVPSSRAHRLSSAPTARCASPTTSTCRVA